LLDLKRAAVLFQS